MKVNAIGGGGRRASYFAILALDLSGTVKSQRQPRHQDAERKRRKPACFNIKLNQMLSISKNK